jgi:putative phage-type endonuclease
MKPMPNFPPPPAVDVRRDRHKFIGASDAPPVLNVSPWRGPVDVWAEKRQLVPLWEGNDATHWGKLVEPLLRQEYAEVTGRSVRLPQQRITHPELSFIACHPDGLTNDGRLLELKTARTSEGWGEAGSDAIPEMYTIQVQHLLCVTQLPVADVAVLFGGSDFQLYEVPADRELQEAIVEAEVEFWGFVESGERPPLDYRAPGSLTVIKKLYPGTNGTTVEADERCLRSRFEIESCKEQIEAASESRDASLAQLLDFMGEAAFLKFPDGKALRRQLTQRKAYEVRANEFIATRWVKA